MMCSTDQQTLSMDVLLHKSWNEFIRKIFLRVCESQEQQLTLTPQRAVPIDDED